MTARIINWFALLVALVVGMAVMHLKAEVKNREETVERLVRQIGDDREAIRVLQAEWALLLSPGVLEERAASFLALMPLRPEQILADPEAVPLRQKGEEAPKDHGVLRLDPDRANPEGGKEKNSRGAQKTRQAFRKQGGA